MMNLNLMNVMNLTPRMTGKSLLINFLVEVNLADQVNLILVKCVTHIDD